jgi:uncharacterized protein YcfJ
MAKTRKKSILSLLGQASYRTGKGAGQYVTNKILNQIQSRLDPRNFARILGGQGLIGDAAVALTGGLMNVISSSTTGTGRKRNKNPQYSSIGNGPVRPLRMGDASADILGKMYNFMRKTDELSVRSREIENAFRQEQLDEDERRHQELVRAIKAFTKKTGKTNTSDTADSKKEGLGLADIVETFLGYQGGKRILAGAGSRLAKGLGNRLSKLAKGLLPKKITNLFKPKPPTVTEPAARVTKEKITTNKGSRTPAPRGSSEAKSSLKSRRAGRGMPMRETEESLSRTQKVAKTAKDMAKGAGKTAVKISSKALNAGKGILKFLLSVPGLSSVVNLAILKYQIDGITEEYTSGKIDEKEYHRRIVEAVGGSLGAVAGGLIGGELGAIAGIEGGPLALVTGVAGAVLGSFAGGKYGEDVANELYNQFEKLDDKELQEKIDKIKNLPANWMDKIKQNSNSNAGKGRGYTSTSPAKQSPAPVIKTSTLPQIKNDSVNGDNKPIVSVNNKVTNVGGNSPKVLSTNTAKQRNSDLDKFLRNTVVPV